MIHFGQRKQVSLLRYIFKIKTNDNKIYTSCEERDSYIFITEQFSIICLMNDAWPIQETCAIIYKAKYFTATNSKQEICFKHTKRRSNALQYNRQSAMKDGISQLFKINNIYWMSENILLSQSVMIRNRKIQKQQQKTVKSRLSVCNLPRITCKKQDKFLG